jgi:cytochrome d ubiquinol oxidase subunit I
MTGGAFVLGVAVWRLIRRPSDDGALFRTAAKVGASVLLIAGLFVLVTGDQLGKHIAVDQPMKFAAAENLRTTEAQAPFSLVTVWDLSGKQVFSIEVPDMLSILATNNPNAQVQGIDNLQAQYAKLYGPGDYSPIVPVTFWTFRMMIGAGMLAALAAAWFLWRMRKGRAPGRGAMAIALVLPLLPLAANSFAWLFNEMGRQPWIVQGQKLTSSAVSSSVGTLEVAVTLVGFTLLYGGLAIVEITLLAKRIRGPVGEAVTSADADGSTPFSY